AVGFPVHGVGHGGDAPGLSRFGAGRLDSGRVLRSVGGRDARADRRRKGPLAVSAGPAGSRRSGSGPRGAEFFVASHRLLPAGGVRGGGEGFGAGLVGPGRVAAGSLLFHDVSPDRAVALPTATTQGEALRPRTPPSPQSAELCGGISRSALVISSTLTSLKVTTRTFLTNLAGRYMSQTQASCIVTSKYISPLSAERGCRSTWLVR